MNNKPRPENAPGPNGLRGGIKVYSSKTQTGPWLEEIGGPGNYQRGFSSAEFQTEAQHQQYGAVKPPPEFGASLGRMSSEEKKSDESAWISTTRSMSLNNTPQTSALPLSLSPEKLETYRKTWTIDSDIGRKIRFETESRRAGNSANAKFQTPSVRSLPGTPKAIENYRDRLIERFGVFAICILRQGVGSGTIPCSQLRTAIDEIGVELKPLDFNQVLAFVTPASTTLSADHFIHIMKGNVTKFDSSKVAKLFSRIADGEESVSTDRLIGSFCDSSDAKYPEILEGITDFLPIYAAVGLQGGGKGGEDGDVQYVRKDDFMRMHEDIFAASPQYFDEVLSTTWSI